MQTSASMRLYSIEKKQMIFEQRMLKNNFKDITLLVYMTLSKLNMEQFNILCIPKPFAVLNINQYQIKEFNKAYHLSINV